MTFRMSVDAHVVRAAPERVPSGPLNYRLLVAADGTHGYRITAADYEDHKAGFASRQEARAAAHAELERLKELQRAARHG